jgi:CubicO group peptidase (beta-lactamase class C family)
VPAPVCHAATVDAAGRLQPGASTARVPWWSFSKTLLAAAALRLAAADRLALDAPHAGHPFTLRQLLRHRAGIGDYGGLEAYHAAVAAGGTPWPRARLLALVPPERLLQPPGTAFAYSNVGYLLVRLAIEEAHGRPLPEALAELVLAPLGLAASVVAETPADMDRTVFSGGHGYHPGWVYHGTVVGPVAEAALALHRLLDGALLGPAALAALIDAMPAGGPLPGRPWQRTGYGLGLMAGEMAAGAGAASLGVMGHTGVGPGSVGAVYRAVPGGRPSTVAVFAAGDDAGRVEREAADRLVARAGSGS